MIEYTLTLKEICEIITSLSNTDKEFDQRIENKAYSHSEIAILKTNEVCMLFCFSNQPIASNTNFTQYYEEWEENAYVNGKKRPYWKYRYEKEENDNIIIILDADCIVSHLFDYYRTRNQILNSSSYIGTADWIETDYNNRLLKMTFKKSEI